MNKVHRIAAHYTPGNGHYGCAKSHLEALKYASDKGYETVLIFEDDFKFTIEPEKTKELFNNLFNDIKKDKWDVVVLSFTLGLKEKSEYPFLNKITEAQSSTGYVIHKNYYPILMNTFKKCVDNMSPKKTTDVNFEKWALDQVWKVNQKEDKWFSFNPFVGEHNFDAKSTIEQITDYNTKSN